MNELLSLALEAHGGLERWQRARTIHADLKLTGGLYALKGLSHGFGPTRMSAKVHLPEVSNAPYPIEAQLGHFTVERSWIENASGSVLEERPQPRHALESVPREQPWDALNALTFTSYAMWNYLTTPFLLTQVGFETEEIEPHNEDGETWRVLRVQFPDHVPTHSREQLFYFSQEGLLQRLDYTAVAPASHYCFDHRTFDGLVFPMLRRVVKRTDRQAHLSAPTAVLIQISSISVD